MSNDSRPNYALYVRQRDTEPWTFFWDYANRVDATLMQRMLHKMGVATTVEDERA